MITDDYNIGKKNLITEDYTMQKAESQSKPAMVRLDADSAARVEAIAKKAGANTSAVLRAAVFLSLVLLEARPDAVNKISKPIGRRTDDHKPVPGEPDYDDTKDWLISLLAADLPREVRTRLETVNSKWGEPLMESLQKALEIGSYFLSLDRYGPSWACASEGGAFDDEIFKKASDALSESVEEFCDRWQVLGCLKSGWPVNPKNRKSFPSFVEDLLKYQELRAFLPDDAATVERKTKAKMKATMMPVPVAPRSGNIPQSIAAYLGEGYLHALISGEGIFKSEGKVWPAVTKRTPKRAKKKSRK